MENQTFSGWGVGINPQIGEARNAIDPLFPDEDNRGLKLTPRTPL